MTVTICKECEFAKRIQITEEPSITGECLSPDAPITHFVHGTKLCKLINTDGQCKFFKRWECLDDDTKPWAGSTDDSAKGDQP